MSEVDSNRDRWCWKAQESRCDSDKGARDPDEIVAYIRYKRST